MRPCRLRCEDREDTPCVAIGRPRLGWTLEAEGRDRAQTGYRILVAATERDLVAERGTLWDSDRVASSRTNHVEYGGRALPLGSEIWWTVRVFDETGAASSWAPPARFRTGLESWTATWITRDRTVDPGVPVPTTDVNPDELLDALEPAIYLRRAFVAERAVRRATVYATARGLVELELNGRRVGDEMLAPGWTDYRKRIEYSPHDVTEQVREGENVLGAVLGDGWYAGHVGFSPRQRADWYGSEPELLCELHVEHTGGGVTVVRSDERWRATADGPIRYSDLLHGERYDARMRLRGWSQAGYDDASWGPVVSRARDDVALVPARAQPIRVTQEIRPVAIRESAPGVYVFDLGQNVVGWVRLAVRGEAGVRVELRFAEMLEDDGSLHLANLRSARPVDTYLLRGGGELETFEPRFTFHGFRYVEARCLTEPPTEETIVGRVVHSDTPACGTFACSNELVNQLHRNIVWGQRGNFLSIPTDCPQRDERMGWLGDGQVFFPTATLNTDVAAFVAKWCQDILDAQSPDGAYPDVAPRLVTLRDGAPAWADAGILVPWMHFQRYGDLRILEWHWPHMERYMAYLRRHNPDLVWRRRRNNDYGDWLAIDEHVPKDLLATAYWAQDAAAMTAMAEALGLYERAEHYKRLRSGVVAAWRAAFLREDGLVEGNTQTGYLLALGFDLLPASQRARAAERLVANIERRDWHLTTGFIGVGLLCPVLTETGYGEVAHRLLLQETFPSWGHSIRHGATTIWERWNGWTEESGFQTPNMNSFNHYSLGSVGAWLVEYVAGIRSDPRQPAYEHVLIAPVPGELTAARATYCSVRGEIVSDWRREDGRFALEATIPPNVTGTIVVPATGAGPLTEGGADAATAPGVRSAVHDGAAWHVEVGSGTYRFEAADAAPVAGDTASPPASSRPYPCR